MPLSERQQAMLDFIREFSLRSKYPPTVREIGRAVGISSTSVVNYNLNALERKGLIERDKEISRGIKLVELSTAQPPANQLEILFQHFLALSRSR